MAQFTTDITKGPVLLTAAEEQPIRLGIFLSFFFFFVEFLRHRSKIFLLYHQHHRIFMGNVLEMVLEQHQPNYCQQLFFFVYIILMCLLQIVSLPESQFSLYAFFL